MATIRLYSAEESASNIGANSTAFANGDLVTLTGGFVTKAGAASVRPLVGAANGTLTTTATNQTVEKKEVSYTRIETGDTRADLVPSADIVQADVGKYYALTAAQLVDVATASATVAAGSVVRLEDVKAARLGTFTFVA